MGHPAMLGTAAPTGLGRDFHTTSGYTLKRGGEQLNKESSIQDGQVRILPSRNLYIYGYIHSWFINEYLYFHCVIIFIMTKRMNRLKHWGPSVAFRNSFYCIMKAIFQNMPKAPTPGILNGFSRPYPFNCQIHRIKDQKSSNSKMLFPKDTEAMKTWQIQ